MHSTFVDYREFVFCHRCSVLCDSVFMTFINLSNLADRFDNVASKKKLNEKSIHGPIWRITLNNK